MLSSPTPRPFPAPSAWAVLLALSLTACGGGGGGSAPAPAPAPPPSATLSTTWGTKTPWALAVPATITLRDGSGNGVSGALSCASDDASKLEVSANCATITGKRLGTQTLTVSSGGLSARVSVKVIPQPQPLGSSGAEVAGTLHLVVTPSGGLLAWGTNVGDMLGQGPGASGLEFSATPLPVKDSAGSGELRGIVAASAGGSVALALTEDGEVLSWGSNTWGGLGRSVNGSASLPGKVVMATGEPLSRVVAISAGDDNAMALLDDGSVASWGSHPGHGDGQTRASNPQLVAAVGGGNGRLSNVVAISAGVNWSAALTADGRVALWGFVSALNFNQNQAGPPFWLNQANGQPVQNAKQISAGFFFGLALTDAGQVLSWGSNSYGQLGVSFGSTPTGNFAQTVQTRSGTPLQDISLVSAGSYSAAALTRGGQVMTWGYGQDGMLGDGFGQSRGVASNVPGLVVGAQGSGSLLGNVASIATSLDHVLTVQSDGSVLIWGQGFRGSLGQGSNSPSRSATPLAVRAAGGSGNLSLGPLSYWPNLLQASR